MEYPKINSLYKREGFVPYNEKKKPRHSPLIEGEYACEEFGAINKWTVTEKVDGTNVRIIFDRNNEGRIGFHGRTDNAQFPTFLLSALQDMFSWEKMDEVFKESNYVILFGEGYGPKIQNGGYYRNDASFILFDVYCSGWWLTRDGITEVAEKLDISHCKPLYLPKPQPNGYETNISPYWTTEEIVKFVKSRPSSIIAKDSHEMEGVIARSEPQMMFRKGGPIMFKLKCKDFN